MTMSDEERKLRLKFQTRIDELETRIDVLKTKLRVVGGANFILVERLLLLPSVLAEFGTDIDDDILAASLIYPRARKQPEWTKAHEVLRAHLRKDPDPDLLIEIFEDLSDRADLGMELDKTAGFPDIVRGGARDDLKTEYVTFLRDLAETLLGIPATHGTDQHHHEMVKEIADYIEGKDDG